MVTRTLVVTCPDCQSQNIIRHGRTEAFKQQVLAAYQQRLSRRDIQRVFKISRNTLTAWFKEKGGSSDTLAGL